MRKELENIPVEVYEELFNGFADSGVPNASNTHFLDDSLNLIAIRCNPIYVTNDIRRNNDWLILIYEGKKYIFKCTADPKTRRNRIANLMPQVYFGNIRCHNYKSGREAICQDLCKVWVRRFFRSKYDAKPVMTYCEENDLWYYDDFGLHHINIHNANGFWNSSLGCIIVAIEKRFRKVFRPVLRSVWESKRNKIPVAVMNIDYFEQKAEAVGGNNFKSIEEALRSRAS